MGYSRKVFPLISTHSNVYSYDYIPCTADYFPDTILQERKDNAYENKESYNRL